ncbi:MAG: hypothetical protein ACI9EF_001953, partial [Pseudohongiellaceae bacterium]
MLSPLTETVSPNPLQGDAMTTETNQLPAPDASCCSHKTAFDILSTCHEHILDVLNVLDRVGQELQKSEAIEEH